jgi:hypothetical protein
MRRRSTAAAAGLKHISEISSLGSGSRLPSMTAAVLDGTNVRLPKTFRRAWRPSKEYGSFAGDEFEALFDRFHARLVEKELR